MDRSAVIILFEFEPDLLRHSAGGGVIGVDVRNQVNCLQGISSEVTTGRCSLGRIAPSLHLYPHVVPDLKFGSAVDGLPGQSAVTNKLSCLRLNDPQAVAEFEAVPLVSVDPGLGFLAALR